MKTIAKKLLTICGILATISCAISFTSAPSASAYTWKGGCRQVLGLVSWDCHASIHDQNSLKSNIWIIAGNIATDIAVIATYLIIGYVIYGGYLYTFSGGDPNKIATGKKAILHAFIGLAITMSANVIISSIRIALVGSSGNIGDCASKGGCVKPDDLVFNLVNWVTAIAGIVSVVFLVYGGIQYVTSSGDPNKVKRAKDTILYSLIGLAIVALAITITAFVSNAIREANNTSFNEFNNNNIIISKEFYDHQIN